MVHTLIIPHTSVHTPLVDKLGTSVRRYQPHLYTNNRFTIQTHIVEVKEKIMKKNIKLTIN